MIRIFIAQQYTMSRPCPSSAKKRSMPPAQSDQRYLIFLTCAENERKAPHHSVLTVSVPVFHPGHLLIRSTWKDGSKKSKILKKNKGRIQIRAAIIMRIGSCFLQYYLQFFQIKTGSPDELPVILSKFLRLYREPSLVHSAYQNAAKNAV